MIQTLPIKGFHKNQKKRTCSTIPTPKRVSTEPLTSLIERATSLKVRRDVLA